MNTVHILDTVHVLAGYLDFPELILLSSCSKESQTLVQESGVLSNKKDAFLKKVFQVSHLMSVVCVEPEAPFLRVDTTEDLLQVSGSEHLKLFSKTLTESFRFTVEELEDFMLEMTFCHDDFQSVHARRTFAADVCPALFLE